MSAGAPVVVKVGGGALPLLKLPTYLVCLIPKAMSASKMEEWLRAYETPIIVRVESEKVLMDMRTVREKEMKILVHAVKELSLQE